VFGVSDTDSFLEEVAEEVRREKFYGYLKKYGWIPIAIVLLIVGATAYFEWNKASQIASAQARGDALTAAFNLDSDAERAAAMADIASESDVASALLKIGQASVLSDAGDIDSAGQLLLAVSQDTTTGAIYRDLASLKRVILLGDAMDIQERLVTLETLSGAGAPFRQIALEQRGIALLSADDTAGAIDVFSNLLQEAGISSNMQRRVGQLIVALGGELPSTPQLLSDQ
jgi:hypothetical protein